MRKTSRTSPTESRKSFSIVKPRTRFFCRTAYFSNFKLSSRILYYEYVLRTTHPIHDEGTANRAGASTWVSPHIWRVSEYAWPWKRLDISGRVDAGLILLRNKLVGWLRYFKHILGSILSMYSTIVLSVKFGRQYYHAIPAIVLVVKGRGRWRRRKQRKQRRRWRCFHVFVCG